MTEQTITGVHGGNTREHAQRLGIEESALTDFSANINPLGMPESLKSAIIAQLDRAERYPDPTYLELYAALARHHGCQPWQIIAGNGATELIFAVISILRPQKTLLLTPSFAEYRRALNKQGGLIVEYALNEANDFNVDSGLLDALSADIDCLFICSPNNPTGQRVAPELLAQIVERCRHIGASLVIDEAFLDFAGDQHSLIPQLIDQPHIFVLRSLTKFFAIPGLRLGYLISGDRDIVTRLKAQQEPWTINAFAELAGRIILDDQQYIAETHRWLKQEQPRLFNALSQFSALNVYPPSANYIFFRCLQPQIDLQARLLEHRILIRSCANYPGLTEGYYRIAVKDRQNNDRLIGALADIFLAENAD
jgi:threonine-phosphate decarboxylase